MKQLSNTVERKFIESYSVEDYEVFTDTRLGRYICYT